MFEKWNPQAKQVVDEALTLSNARGFTKIGTESFLQCMFSIESSICRFILTEYDITEADILEASSDMIILRKTDNEYTDKLLQVFKTSEAIALENEQDEVTVDDLFLAFLLIRDTCFQAIIERMELNADALIEDVKEILDVATDDDELKSYTTNLTHKAKNNELMPFIGRDEYIQRLLIVLSRKNKNNPLLIGSAGVGKTAIVEGLAQYCLKNKVNLEFISLNLSAMLANTKYRGDFEARLDKITKLIMSKPNIVLFIDEIHTIMGAGSSEGTLDAANILKPFLARNNFKCLGATTQEEYRRTIMTDKALNRRFQSVFVAEPTCTESKHILLGLRDSFEKYHKNIVSEDIIDYVVKTASKKMPMRKFPDKAIDLLDEAMSSAKIEGKDLVSVNDIDDAFLRISGLSKVRLKKQYKYEEFRPFFIDNLLGINTRKTLLTVKYVGTLSGLQDLVSELLEGYGITEEMVLDLDLGNYKEAFSLSSLIGSPPGYVGYQEGGVFSEHLGKFPYALVTIDNYKDGYFEVQNFFMNIIKKGFFYDKKGRYVSCSNLIIVCLLNQDNDQRKVGYIPSQQENTHPLMDLFDIVITEASGSERKKDSYQNVLHDHGFNVDYDESLFSKHKPIYQEALIDLLSSFPKGKYSLAFDHSVNKVLIEQKE